jgi:hypothetical protein
LPGSGARSESVPVDKVADDCADDNIAFLGKMLTEFIVKEGAPIGVSGNICGRINLSQFGGNPF